ncbi:MAG: hypothetical protein KF781_02025 [Chitinophagaceae bacterium]|nr:hypothetical protein [Chitinophagaceae bacterium]MCW5904286.1 hypothetical protein [Chitinophagaceae bacterium]
MLKRILLLTTFALVAFNINAQPTKQRGERIQALKVAYITQVLKLTPEEAQSFWPIYNAYFEESKKARAEYKDDELQYQEKSLEIKKKYKPEFKKILKDDARVNLVYKAETDFLLEMQKEIKKRMQQRQQRLKQGNQ